MVAEWVVMAVADGVTVASLPRGLPLDQMQTRWASVLNPVLANPLNDVLILPNQVLTSGINVINHRLGQMLQGWFLTDIQGAATIYRSAPLSSTTLTLTSSAAVTCNIGVF